MSDDPPPDGRPDDETDPPTDRPGDEARPSVSRSDDEADHGATGRRTDDRGPDEAYCRDCGAVIDRRAELCPDCGVRQRPPSSSLEDRLAGGDPVVAAVLSAVFPGLGQLYNRELTRGIAFVLGSFLAVFSVLVGIGLVLFPAVYVYAIYDAYTRAEEAFARREDTQPA